MANLITYAYFQSGLLAVSNVTASAVIQAAVTDYITRYEERFIKMLLGEDLYDEDWVTTKADAKWAAFKALLYNGTDLWSPIANYVWWQFKSDHQIIGTQGGDKKTADSNATPEANVSKYMSVWSDMRFRIDAIIDYFNDNLDTFPEWDSGASADYYFSEINSFDI